MGVVICGLSVGGMAAWALACWSPFVPCKLGQRKCIWVSLSETSIVDQSSITVRSIAWSIGVVAQALPLVDDVPQRGQSCS